VNTNKNQKHDLTRIRHWSKLGYRNCQRHWAQKLWEPLKLLLRQKV